jgi:thiol-disulfide isomerase/thioredoxin
MSRKDIEMDQILDSIYSGIIANHAELERVNSPFVNRIYSTLVDFRLRQQGIAPREKWDNLPKLSKLPFFKSFLILSLNNLNDIDPQERDLIYSKIKAADFADEDLNMLYLDLKKQNPTFANITLGDAEKVKLVDTKNNLVTLSKILDQRKGKLVLIDFWASWCVPCREQYPAFKKAELNFKGQKIVFLNFSIDEDDKTAAWKKALQEEKESISETHFD